jgi:predicted ABC-class ATPase
MKSSRDLQNDLNRINGKGYKAYKDIQGEYTFNNYVLSIDYVQGDPFASPSRIRVIVEQKIAKFPQKLFDENHKRIAVIDFLTRLFSKNIRRFYDRVKGSGKSGILSIDSCGQEILDRTSIYINKERVEARLEVGLPAAGRRILSKEAEEIFIEAIPEIVNKSLIFNNINSSKLIKQVKLVEDQTYIRKELLRRGLCAFIANGSILPRESGISQRPMSEGAVDFKSPETLQIEIELPNRGKVLGMAIPKGVNLIVGGGYHGKSTMLKALELGVYNHIEGDGREFVITDDSAVKIRAEDGRRIEKVNITPFINNLPNGKDTWNFYTENASGSTSQAANIMEAIEMQAKVLLIDEDTSATNFMIRDKKMQRLVSADKEPITPFIDRVRELYEKHGISTILVVGSSGDYFNKADNIIMMDEYKPLDVTEKAKKIIIQSKSTEETIYNKEIILRTNRVILSSSFPKSYKGVKIKAKGLYTVTYNKLNIELNYLEQLIDSSQTNCIANIIKYTMDNIVDNKTNIKDVIDRIYEEIEYKGLHVISSLKGHPGNMALPRRFEIAAAFNRFRNLKIK